MTLRRAATLALLCVTACSGDDETLPADGAPAIDVSAPAIDADVTTIDADVTAIDASPADAAPVIDAGPMIDSGPCPGAYQPASNGRCYFVSSTALPWLSARVQCESTGGFLAQAEDSAENDVLAALAGFDAWLGGYDAILEGDWRWSSGLPIGFQPWAMGEPDDAGGAQDCLLLVDDGSWSDLACDQNRGFVCEISEN